MPQWPRRRESKRRGGGGSRGESSDERDDLDRGLAFLGDGAPYFSDLGYQGPSAREIDVHFRDFPE